MENRKIYTLGPEFSYSHIVTRKQFKDEKILFEKNIENVFRRVSREDALGVVPVENLINGTVRETLFCLKKYKVKINLCLDLRIEHVLASQTESFKKIVSHSQALAQSSEFLSQLDVEQESCSSTSQAMSIARSDASCAGVGSEQSARFNDLKIIKRNIGNNQNNKTRFFLISKEEQEVGDKTSLIIEPFEDKTGLLFEILAIFKIKDINLSKIESIPSGDKLGKYIFYIEVDSSLESQGVREAITFLKTIVNVYSFGSYEKL